MAKIMVVDDDPAGQRLIKFMLSAEGHEVIAASNGLQGVQMATQQSPDLIILDVMLPGLDGFEVCRRLRTSARTAVTPIIMLSGKAQSSDRDTGLKMGANEYMVKPVDRQQLSKVVGALLQTAKTAKTKTGKLYAFIGARGGAGTSTISVNVATALEKAAHSAILADLNPSYSAIGELTGLNPEKSIAGLFKDAAGTVDTNNLKDLFKQHDSGFKLLWADAYPEETVSYTTDDIRNLFDELTGLADYVIADISASPSENAIAVLAKADVVYLVTGASKEARERLPNAVTRLTRFGVKQERIQVIAVDRTAESENNDLEGRDSISGLPLAGYLHNCREECIVAEEKGVPVLLSAPDSPIAADFTQLAAVISKS